MRFGLALIVLAGFGAPAAACINDDELPKHEREFRSNYGDPTYPEPAPVPPEVVDFADFSSHPGLLGFGAMLLTGAFFVAMNDKRTRT